ncbi:MAG: radical SAM protein [Oscillospiraceae bacterium]|nr:radical SAM protein [Oscillospiraceae bacterium]
MNEYVKNLNRIEFMITLACTGKCRHCSEGEHISDGTHIDGDIAARAVCDLCGKFDVKSLMTFGGEPLLYPDAVFKIHSAAKDMNIPKRTVITNGFFSKSESVIKETALKLSQSGVNSVLLSVGAFHQETIPLEYVKIFAEAIKSAGIPIRVHPAWLVDKNDDNKYNKRTNEILDEFRITGITVSDGNIIFPSGNAVKYLGEYFDPNINYVNPYEEDPQDVRSVCISPNGDVLSGNIYQKDISAIIENYVPHCR